jgi:hypothetical protein
MATWRNFGTGLILMAMMAFVIGAGCSGHTASPAPKIDTITAGFDATRSWADLEAQIAFGPRVPGTPAHTSCRDWLQQSLKATTDDVTLQNFSRQIGGKTVQMWNVVAHFTGTGPAPRQRVLLCAHWDSRPTADKDPDPAKRFTPIDGADDGASGVAILLELARQLKAYPIARDVTIVFFDGEDYGPLIDNMLLGSKYYAAHLPTPKPSWGILLDMVGDKDLGIYREPSSELAAKAVNNRVFSAAKTLGFLRTATLPGFIDAPYQYAITDDHTPLNDAGVPTADLIDFDYPYWHTTQDTADKCSKESLRVVGKTVLYAIQLP